MPASSKYQSPSTFLKRTEAKYSLRAPLRARVRTINGNDRAGIFSWRNWSHGPAGTTPTMVSASHSFSHHRLQAAIASRAQGGEGQASLGPDSGTTSPV